jgi:hypothetical protein
VHTLHESGFRVQLASGSGGTTVPEAGTPLRTGSIVRLYQQRLTVFTSQSVRDALARAGLLVEVRGSLPESLTGITDDSRQVSGRVAVRRRPRHGAGWA